MKRSRTDLRQFRLTDGNGTATTGKQEDEAAVDDRQAGAATAQAGPAPTPSPGPEESGDASEPGKALSAMAATNPEFEAAVVSAPEPLPPVGKPAIETTPESLSDKQNTDEGVSTPTKQPETGDQRTAGSDVIKPPSTDDILAVLAAKPSPQPDPAKPAIGSDEKQVPKGAGGGTPDPKANQTKTEPPGRSTSKHSAGALIAATAAPDTGKKAVAVAPAADPEPKRPTQPAAREPETQSPKNPSPKAQIKSVDQRATEANAKAGPAPTPASKQPAAEDQPTAGSDVTNPAGTANNLAVLTAVTLATPNPPPALVEPAVESDEKAAIAGGKGDSPAPNADQTKIGPPSGSTSENFSKSLGVATAATATAPEGNGGDLPSATGLDTVGLEERLRHFLATYCDAYTAKNLDAFTDFFTADAMENGKTFKSLLPKYEKNFTLISTIQYRIRLKDFSVEEDRTVTLNGDFLLEWLPPGKKWRENSGKISMRLKESGSTFLVQRLDYHGD